VNIIWVLDDMDEGNGATRYVPGSHRWQTLDDVPENPRALSVPFEAPAGAVLAMDGRLWHTSGANRSVDRERALLFGFYCADHIRPQSNWNVQLRREVQDGLSAVMREWLGLDGGNVRYGSTLTTLPS
jgi:ectoine hydroxylase-related dioxygenase (phytanoyl-CoA dioxygenase family)